MIGVGLSRLMGWKADLNNPQLEVNNVSLSHKIMHRILMSKTIDIIRRYSLVNVVGRLFSLLPFLSHVPSFIVCFFSCRLMFI